MSTVEGDKVFSDSISQFYETHLVPLIFEPYATDLVDRLVGRPLTCVLEIAAGTGVVTRALAARLPDTVTIVATDLNQPMIDRAASLGTAREVEWRQADAMRLPFADGSFDAVRPSSVEGGIGASDSAMTACGNAGRDTIVAAPIRASSTYRTDEPFSPINCSLSISNSSASTEILCQFGVMFFPDKPRAFSEARRVLKPGGVYLFNVWDRIEENGFADTITTALASEFPQDPPRFLPRTPHGYFDHAMIARDLREAWFNASPQITTVPARSRARSPLDPAIAY